MMPSCVARVTKRVVVLAAMAGALVFGTAPMWAASCESLAKVKLADGRIDAAQTVAAGAFNVPGDAGNAAANAVYRKLPAFCRVTATLTPSSDSDIKVEVWLPVAGWNKKLQAVGNGGWAGSISYSALADAVAHGYASASTDTGHTGRSAEFALGHREKVVDVAYRAVHEMTVKAKVIVAAYYGGAASLSVWNGCSTGGQQGVTEAMKYPADFDAIVAGASAVHHLSLHVARVALDAFENRSADGYIPPTKYSLVHDAVLKACDALDGVKDGVIENPRACHFDPKVLACKGADGPDCLNPAQVDTARALYAPVKNPKSGAELMPALLMPGSELGWATIAGPQPNDLALDALRYVEFQDPSWDWHRFNAATDIDRALKADNGLLDATDPNLKPFFDRGGKLLMYHGWADPQVTPMDSVDYYNDVVKTLGAGVVGRSIALYMVPGMNHCQGGPGTDTFDKMGAMEEWVAKGMAPKLIVASHLSGGTVDRTRPLCPYPQVAAYKGSGSTDEAGSFVCRVP